MAITSGMRYRTSEFVASRRRTSRSEWCGVVKGVAMKEESSPVTVVLVHGAWADGSSWSKVLAALRQSGVAVTAAPIPLTSLSDDVVAVDRAIDRVGGP